MIKLHTFEKNTEGEEVRAPVWLDPKHIHYIKRWTGTNSVLRTEIQVGMVKFVVLESIVEVQDAVNSAGSVDDPVFRYRPRHAHFGKYYDRDGVPSKRVLRSSMLELFLGAGMVFNGTVGGEGKIFKLLRPNGDEVKIYMGVSINGKKTYNRTIRDIKDDRGRSCVWYAFLFYPLGNLYMISREDIQNEYWMDEPHDGESHDWLDAYPNKDHVPNTHTLDPSDIKKDKYLYANRVGHLLSGEQWWPWYPELDAQKVHDRGYI